MENFNYKTKKWKKETMPSNEDIHKIVGDNVRVAIDSDGNIEIDKTLTPSERSQIEAL